MKPWPFLATLFCLLLPAVNASIFSCPTSGLMSRLFPTWCDFWGDAQDIAHKVQTYTDDIISDLIKKNIPATDMNHMRDEFNAAVAQTHRLHEYLEERNISLSHLSEELSRALQEIDVEKLVREEFPPPSDASGHEVRAAGINATLSRAGEVIVHVCTTQFGLPEDDVRAHWTAIHAILLLALVLFGDLAEQHPTLVESLLFVGAGLIVPEMVLQPIVSMLGFGPYGPVKGSVASWAQRYFWGGAVEAGSWFSFLQRAGMVGFSWWRILAGVVFSAVF